MGKFLPNLHVNKQLVIAFIFVLVLGHLISIKNQLLRKHIIDFKRQKTYHRDKKGKRFVHKWGPSSVPANCKNIELFIVILDFLFVLVFLNIIFY